MIEVAQQVLRQALQASDSELRSNGLRVLCVAASLLLLETFIIVGPPRALILRVFLPGNQAEHHSKKARRLVSQLAARLVGCIFLAVMFPLAFKTLQDSHIKKDKLYAHTETSSLCMAIAAGYFLYDVFICTVRFHENGLAFMIHAMGCCTVFMYAALHNTLHFYGAAFLMWELSTPFVYVRWVLLKLGKAESRLVAINNLLGVLVFFLCRNVYGPIVSWDFFTSSAADLAAPRPGSFSPTTISIFRVLCVTLNGLNYFWMYQMIRLALMGSPHPKHAKKEN